MVGLVVVCHSRALARAAVALAAEMLQGAPVPIEIAAGLDETTFGTDAMAIMAAVTAADQGDGVVVLMDLGSAVLSAELALELLDDDQRAGVLLCPAPLVEGLVAAAVAAASGAQRAEVAAEATNALAGKQSHLGPSEAPDQDLSPRTGDGPTVTITVSNAHGLHARPAARLVTEARKFDAQVEIRNLSTNSGWVPASSLSQVATLGALHGHEVELRSTGPQAREALEHLVALAARAFGETPATEAPSVRKEGAAGRASGLGASAGIGIGPAFRAGAAPPVLPQVASLGEEAEWARVGEALEEVRQELRRVRAATAQDTGEEAAAIFDAHLLLLDDADLLSDVHDRVRQGVAAPQAFSAAGERLGAQFAALPDPYLRARAADVQAVADQMVRALTGVFGHSDVGGSGVLIAGDLSPAEAAMLDPGRVVGVLLAFGSPTAHGAILARARGVPAVVACGPAVLDVADGTLIALDGSTGEVVVAPSDEELARFRARASAQDAAREQAVARAAGPATTRDGVSVEVGANIGSAADARAAARSGADLAGLVRTEFLFLGRDEAPDQDEQVAVYRELAEALSGRRITLRTLDVGGDKPLPYAAGATEANPFLGVRGIRHSFAHPELLTQQLAAIVRIAREVPVSIMFPMVSSVSELLQARSRLDAAAGGDLPTGLRVGIMMEVPAAALKAPSFVPHVDFFSVGTNDLAQYTLAVERGNPALAALADGLDPAVLRLIDGICRAAGDRVTVSVCGELAADEVAVPVLAGLGVRELSVAPRLVPAVKEAVRAADLGADRKRAQLALDLPDATAVRELLSRP